MKNLKISVKILSSFGLVILLMAVITVIVTLSNLQTIDNVSMIDKDSTLQTKSNNLRENFLEACIPANILIYTVDESIYASFQSVSASVEEGFSGLYEYIDSEPSVEKYRPSLTEAENAINEYFSVVKQLNTYNQLEIKGEDGIASKGAELNEANSLFISGQLESLQSEIDSNANARVLSKRKQRVEEANSIIDKITSFRVKSRVITLTYNTETLPDILAAMDEAIELTTAFRDASTEQNEKSAAQRLINALENYRIGFVDFGMICDKASEAAGKLPVLNQTALDEFDQALTSIDEAVTSQVNRTSSSALTAFTSIIIIASISLAFAVIIAIILMRGITNPMNVMHNVIRKVRETGILKFTEQEKAELSSAASKDEIGQSIEAFSGMMDRFAELADNLEVIAGGDLSVSVKAVSHDDTMGKALIYMLDNLNHMFTSINEAAEQVNSGSEQVSSASQALAQGATEQASSIEELSASIQEISSQVAENSENAEKASVVAGETGTEVQIGNEQMGQMLKAMDDINASSNEINKIIMVIDGIASQTNILALNAAVEAARAGDAGKGFAVVAEEVRNLASKSADAAKQTNDLIASSIKSVNNGAEIAKKTAQSLSNIETKAKEVDRFIAEIANASKEQAQGISQINIGVEQISGVVQTNSATAEESAAAAEELSGQANLLTEQIAGFKLK